MEKKLRKNIKDLLIITVGSIFYAIGISMFLDPNQLAPGGVTGIAVILNRLTNIETGTLYFLLNVPIVLLGTWKFGVRFIAKTFYAVTASSIFTNLLSPYGALTDDLFIASAAGGIMIAIGIGTIFKTGATTGGIDIIIKILRQKYRHIKTSLLFQMTDLIIVGISGLVFRDWNVIFYALLTVFIDGKALDYVLYGGDQAKMMFIITEKPEKIGKRLMADLDVGLTYLQGEGGWTGKKKKVVFTLVPHRLGAEVQDIVKSEDPEAFMVVTSANEIYGEGYKDIFEEAI